MFEQYGIHFDPALRDEIVRRVDRLHLPSYTGFVQPRLEAVIDSSGRIADVRISYPQDLEQQMLRVPVSGAVPETTDETARGWRSGRGVVDRQRAGCRPRPRAQTADPAARLNAAIDPVINALWSSFDERAAMGHVQFISQYWRLPGNSGYDKSLDRVAERLNSVPGSSG